MDENKNRSAELCRRVVTTESFIEEAKAIYGDTYDYSKVDYLNNSHKVIVVCKKHGDFEVFAREHLDGKGCPKCARAEKFLEKLQEKFPDRFGTENFLYIDSQTPVELVCKKHGAFRRSPSSILNSSCGCPECGNELSLQMQVEAKIASEQRKEEQRREKQAMLDNYYGSLVNVVVTQVDSRQEYVEKIVNILKELDDDSLYEVMCHLRREQRKRREDAFFSLSGPVEQELSLPTSFVAVDFETLYAQRVSACSIGMVKYKDSKIVDRFYTPIRPPFDYPGKCGSAITWIHGFTEEMLKDERTFAEILPDIETFIEGLPLVAHNASVEKSCFRECLAYYGLSANIDYENIWDTLPLSRMIERSKGIEAEGPGLHSLDAVCRRFGVPELRHHNALDDAEMCGNLFLTFSQDEINIQERVTSASGSITENHQKYNKEDKIQRTDLENVADNPFKDKVVVLTGFAVSASQEYAHKLNELGAIIKTGVTKKTNILITGYNAGPSKMQKAQEFGAQIIPEEEFLKMIENNK